MSVTSPSQTPTAALINSTEDAAALSFNISFSVNLGSLLSYPSRLLTRMRRLDDLFNMNPHMDNAGTATTADAGSGGLMRRLRAERPPPPGGFALMPGPWAFFASGYAVALFAMDDVSNSHVVLSLQVTNALWGWLQTIDAWAAHKEMEDVCWSTFVAVCGALAMGSLTRGLEGIGAANTSPFNLFGYAFLLHLYSSPITHTLKLEELPSRPDMHVAITIIMPLLQLFVIHFIGIKQSWSNKRLIPTTICSVLTVIHFHSVIWFSSSSYPLLNYMPCLFESLLILVTFLAFVLNALTQLLLEGTVTRPLFGHAATLMPRWDEDFSIVLLRLGTASLEATSVAGLGNEVSGVPVSSADAGADTKLHSDYVELDRAGVTVSHATGKQRRDRDGFANEIRGVRVGSRQGDLWFDHAWTRELVRFGEGIKKVVVGFWRLTWGYMRGQPLYRREETAQHEADMISPRSGEHIDEMSEERQDVYDRFLMGEIVSDDEDDFDPHSSMPGVEDDDSSVDSDEAGGKEPGWEDNSETAVLYADLSTTASSSATAPLLLAHMTNTSASPLTRRRYKRLIAGQQQQPEGSWTAFRTPRTPASPVLTTVLVLTREMASAAASTSALPIASGSGAQHHQQQQHQLLLQQQQEQQQLGQAGASIKTSQPPLVAQGDWTKNLVHLAKTAELKKHALSLQLATAHALSAHATLDQKLQAIQDIKEQKNNHFLAKADIMEAQISNERHEALTDSFPCNDANRCAELRNRIQQITDGEFASAKRDVDALRGELGQPPMQSLQATLEEKSAQYLAERRMNSEVGHKRAADELMLTDGAPAPGKRPRGRPKGSKNRKGATASTSGS
ncbi:hypothetical protein EW146_g566 [Bondarzewia mesenterica]|uniref:Uncharacterized protein n=1 Tax=Bondarzewia mesenterica TaxID=1095465 RepID=A0A4V3XGC7_9AGAM|nr:hypothetical protein EW146_g566 [Bondarzewia mesenterica]